MSVAIGIAHPAASGLARRAVMTRKTSAGTDHAADRGNDRQHGLRALAQRSDDQLTFELEAGDEEEDGEQAVSGPRLE